jgi:hypothetical protein
MDEQRTWERSNFSIQGGHDYAKYAERWGGSIAKKMSKWSNLSWKRERREAIVGHETWQKKRKEDAGNQNKTSKFCSFKVFKCQTELLKLKRCPFPASCRDTGTPEKSLRQIEMKYWDRKDSGKGIRGRQKHVESLSERRCRDNIIFIESHDNIKAGYHNLEMHSSISGKSEVFHKNHQDFF